MSYAEKGMEPKMVMLREITQTLKDKYHVFSHMWYHRGVEDDMKAERGLCGKGGGQR